MFQQSLDPVDGSLALMCDIVWLQSTPVLDWMVP